MPVLKNIAAIAKGMSITFMETVSYTHLDVYKRQINGQRNRKWHRRFLVEHRYLLLAPIFLHHEIFFLEPCLLYTSRCV